MTVSLQTIRAHLSVVLARLRGLPPLDMLVAAQAVYVVSGLFLLEFSLSWLDAAAAVGAAVVAEWVFARSWRFVPKSGLAAGLGVAIFFRASDPFYFALASIVAISSKYLIKVHGRHIFNPSNIAIVSLVFLFPAATTIEFTQWGNNAWWYAAVATVSLFIAYRAGVGATTFSFIGAYAVLLAALSAHDSMFSAHHYGLIGPSFILFASFMITDPKTAPRGVLRGSIHGLCVALLYFALEAAGVRYAIFLAPFLLTVLNAPVAFLWRSKGWEKVPFNAVAFCIALAFFAFQMGQMSWLPHFKVSRAFQISPNFILFGVESEKVLQCAATPLYRPNDRAGVADHAVTRGAAWGDYDNDGYEDLFVSNQDRPSILYRNNGDGTFTDATAEAGLSGVHASSAFFVDYDNSGSLDLFVASPSDRWLQAYGPLPVANLQRSNFVRVYRNQGGRFVDATQALGLADARWVRSTATLSFADYNKDGLLDFVAALPGRYLHLTSVKFRALHKSIADPFFPRQTERLCGAQQLGEVAQELVRMAQPLYGAEGARQEMEALIAEGVCAEVTYRLPRLSSSSLQKDRQIIDATVFIPGSVFLFKNERNRFVEIQAFREQVESTRVQDQKTSTFGKVNEYPYGKISGVYWQPVSFDYDGDGLPDIFLNIDFGSNLLLRNTGGFNFENMTAVAGMDYRANGMGAAVGDYNNDGLPDLVSTNSRDDYLYRNNGDGTFTNLFAEVPLATLGVGWGIAFLDFDLDRHQDLAIANGDIITTLGSFSPELNRPLFRSDKLYRNDGRGGFADATDQLCPEMRSGWALAAADYDNDGDVDLFVGNIDARSFGHRLRSGGNMLYENTLADKRFLRVRLEGTRSNRMGVGAAVEVRSPDGLTQTQWMVVGSHYSQNGQVLIFGLGEVPGPVAVSVLWPSGRRSVLPAVEHNQTLLIREPY
jgi:hypothetical protein